MAKYDETKQLRCSFCGKPQDQVRRLVAGPNVYICDECIELCQEIISEEFAQTLHEEATLTSSALPKPREIVEALSDYVIDQDEAKKILAVAVYNHYKRIQALDKKNKEIGTSIFPTLNPETKIIGVNIKDDICYVNLNNAFLTLTGNVTADTAIYSLVNSLTELPGVLKVQLAVDGETEVKLGERTLSALFERNMEPVQTGEKQAD